MVQRKKIRKLVAFQSREHPRDIIQEIFEAACDAEVESAQGFYITHRDIVYRITAADEWIPSILYG